jgi:hypothetical protein
MIRYRQKGAMPLPSSSISIETPVGPAVAVTRTHDAACRVAFSRRLPRTSARSVRSNGARSESGRCGSNLISAPAGVRTRVAISERTSGASSVDNPWRTPPWRRAFASSRSTCRVMASATASISSAIALSPRSRSRPTSAARAASGDFRPWARSAARPRERLISRSWVSSIALTSSTRGRTSAGTAVGNRRLRPDLMSAIPRRRAASGRLDRSRCRKHGAQEC